MTFSIAFFDPETGTAGVAAATGIASVGAFVPHVEAGVGALTTQGMFTNWLYGRKGLRLLQRCGDAEKVLQELVAEDEGREYRQCLVIDRHGTGTGWTGKRNRGIKQIATAGGVVAGGNFLAAEGVVPAVLDTFLATAGEPAALRLIEALRAGEDAGGDSRGLVSAVVKVDFFEKPPVDLRVDYEPHHPLRKLQEIYESYHSSPFKEFYDGVPTRVDYSKYGQVK